MDASVLAKRKYHWKWLHANFKYNKLDEEYKRSVHFQWIPGLKYSHKNVGFDYTLTKYGHVFDFV